MLSLSHEKKKNRLTRFRASFLAFVRENLLIELQSPGRMPTRMRGDDQTGRAAARLPLKE
jgi:hypothetical protein